jgi:hypothetical protein
LIARGDEGKRAEEMARKKRDESKRRANMIDNNPDIDENHPAHKDHPDMKDNLLNNKFFVGDAVSVFDPENPQAHPNTDWRKAHVVEICDDGDVAVRYDGGGPDDEEECAVDDLRLIARGDEGKRAEDMARKKRDESKRRANMIDNNPDIDENHPAHKDHPVMAKALEHAVNSNYYIGDKVLVFQDSCPDGHPDTDWKSAVVVEICNDGDIAVAYSKEDEEEVAPDG